MPKTEFTQDQLKAITTRNYDLLVSAAAGSGKTAVLVERIIRIISDDQKPVDVDRLLVVTFTEAAASEMRQRILTALQKKLEDDPENSHINKQILLLNKASITTIHSFCLSVIRKYFYLIDIDPSFRIIDATESDLLKTEIMREFFEELYEDENTIESTFGIKNNDNFLDLVESFGDKVKDDKLQTIALKLYNFTQSSPIPEKWLLNSCEKMLITSVEDLENTDWYKLFINELRETLNVALYAMGLIYNMQDAAQINDKAMEALATDEENLNNIVSNLDTGFESIYNAFQFTFSRLTLKTRGEEISEDIEIAREALQKTRDSLIKDPITKIIKKALFQCPQDIVNTIKSSHSNIKALSDIVIGFSKKYYDIKRQRNIADFNDFEHLCIKALIDKNSTDENIILTSAALELKEFYEEVLTDEYQDSNSVQELILSAVSKNQVGENNRFMVGDIKQSIYKFRMANPDLFINKYASFHKEITESTTQLRIDLSQNFRSRQNILDSINFIFKQIMSQRLGEVVYDDKAALNYGATYNEERADLSTELIVISSNSIEEEVVVEENQDVEEDNSTNIILELSNAEYEAKVVANRITDMLNPVNPFLIMDKSGLNKPVEPKDIVILLRSPKSVAEIYVREFKKQNIQIFSENSTGYFENIEIMTMISLLRTIDNPRQDIDLIASLYSPIFGVTIDELVEIRHISNDGLFYDAMKIYIDKGENIELIIKLNLFIDRLNKWRTLSTTNSISELIWTIYGETGYVNEVSVTDGGKIRKANLIALFERAVNFEETNKKSLFLFIKYIEKLQKSSSEFGNAKTISQEDNAVRVMSIHKSKGLEFPVVFLCGLGKKFNLSDSKENILLHQHYGFGAVNVDLEQRITYNTLSRYVIGNKINEESISEEIRVLYVALTRAKEKLILVGVCKDVASTLDNINMFLTENTSIPISLLKRSTTFLNYILCGLARHKVSEPLYSKDKPQLFVPELYYDKSQWEIKVIDKSSLNNKELLMEKKTTDLYDTLTNLDKSKDYSGNKLIIDKILSYSYNDYTGSYIPSKISISEIKRMNYERFMKESEGFETTFVPDYFKTIVLNKPEFIEKSKITSARIGTLIHSVMERIDFSKNNNAEDIKNIIDNMVTNNLIEENEAKFININKILNFINGELGLRMRASNKILKEVPFVIGLPPHEINPEWKQEKENIILVHGIIDCMFYENDDIILLDYKSDKVNNDNLERVLLNYKVQLQIYKKAIEAETGKCVKQSIIYFFELSDFFIV